ncbi:hypothetical protein [Paenibacillus sp. P32E]|uniref:hypothetical protein n=1 Tax=Paenibacillus sp. P32E TaxID=1349434 RepID=UPI00093DBA40|nr:hypothetical protein [Paenibacillus sp. P32E]OKP93689.1 hypothetical protein A3848_04050 [Paenibacillus sp. P32E]
MNGDFFLLQYQKTAGGGMKLVDLDFRINAVDPGSTARKSFYTGKGKLLLKTVKVIPIGVSSSCELTIVRSATAEISDMKEVVYANATEYSTGNTADGIYDLVDIPYVDADGTRNIHLALKNTLSTGTAVDFRIIIEAIELK